MKKLPVEGGQTHASEGGGLGTPQTIAPKAGTKPKSIKEFKFGDLQGKVGGVKQFTCGRTYKENNQTALCQVKGCYEKGRWFVEFKGKVLLLCFKHGEDA